MINISIFVCGDRWYDFINGHFRILNWSYRPLLWEHVRTIVSGLLFRESPQTSRAFPMNFLGFSCHSQRISPEELARNMVTSIRASVALPVGAQCQLCWGSWIADWEEGCGQCWSVNKGALFWNLREVRNHVNGYKMTCILPIDTLVKG